MAELTLYISIVASKIITEKPNCDIFISDGTLVWIAEKTLIEKNQNKVFKLRL